MNTKITGNKGEEKAAKYLLENDYKIIERNWRTRKGEIDIIAEKNGTLVFVEVKTLPSGNIETLSHLLDKRKQKRIEETAKCFIVKNRKYNSSYIRFDVIIIDMPEFPDIYHIEDAFCE